MQYSPTHLDTPFPTLILFRAIILLLILIQIVHLPQYSTESYIISIFLEIWIMDALIIRTTLIVWVALVIRIALEICECISNLQLPRVDVLCGGRLPIRLHLPSQLVVRYSPTTISRLPRNNWLYSICAHHLHRLKLLSQI